MRTSWLLSSLALFLAAPLAAMPLQDAKTVWSGVYTDAQARKVARNTNRVAAAVTRPIFRQRRRLPQGDVFIRDWGGKTLDMFYERMKTTMPRGAPASLSDDAYLTVVAYILRQMDFPQIPWQNSSRLLQTIRVESKEGAGFIPNSALVDSIGCLTQGLTISGC
jgi:hypothetical protein